MGGLVREVEGVIVNEPIAEEQEHLVALTEAKTKLRG